ncbi:uncharacterized protein DUF3710 [Halopolyspora algeriensis]|uniref:Uncharacterized protein DUF3710 n=1 Tax=Halopolyspora algeriensis TaxID=1500506 RepID=A0A368VS88_9ACTN|nr:DUF3710 domain-containing protein [Halopolyspora algeriensis]RCW43985.1 uncharacterized protein DUF3710 [Halopolyspora algeriensis]TQM53512.1 uncharacterized protein DUF3710 [Halopolyspora algeriensis]
MFGWGRRRGRHTQADEWDTSAEGGGDAEDPDVDADVDIGGPYDVAEAPEDEVERLDLGSVRLPVPEGSQLQVEVDPAGPVRAVHLLTQVGRLTVSAFAAPRTSGLWQEVRRELLEQLRSDGAQVRVDEGEWGPELTADTSQAVLRFVGVDGPRWLLRGVAAAPAENIEACGKLLYALIDETVVVRGEEPMPVRAPLPIELPEEIARHIQQAQEQTE